MIQLQLALDVLKTKEAIKIASQTAAFVNIIEAGTPLIKQESLRAVGALKKRFPKKTILADTKTMDVGAFEAKLAFDVGADIMTVCLAAPQETISAAINAAKKKKQVMLDTVGLNREEIVKKLKQLKKLPSYVCLHRAIDERLSKSIIIDLFAAIQDVKKVTENRVKVAVAGSIDARIVRQITTLKTKPDIVVVGSVITKARKPRTAAKKIYNILQE